MLIFPETQTLATFRQDPNPTLARLRTKRFKIAIYLTANGKDAAVVMSPRVFAAIESELLRLELDNSLYEMDLEEFRIGKLSPEELRKRIHPNPKALGIPAKEAFAKLRQKIKRRQARQKNRKSKIKNRKSK